MNIEDIFKKHISTITICMVDEEEELKEIELFHKDFNERYQITPKEPWCVTFTTAEHIDSTAISGPFESEEIAKKFAKTWNERRDAFCDKTIEDDPDGDYEFNYIKAKAVQLSFSSMNQKLLEEIK